MAKKVTLSVVGMDYRVTKPTRQKMNEATPFKVRIEREPENDHDSNALKVVVADKTMQQDEMHIGYLSRLVASEWSPVIDKGKLKITEAWMTEVPDEGDGQALLTVTGLSKSLQEKSAIGG